jgi:hypothetical protein
VSFVHDDPDFPQLLAIAARETGVAAALVEKDYWVTHCRWALHETGLELWFKGGTSVDEPALLLDDAGRRAEIVRAFDRIAPMFWSDRIPLDEACAVIVAWIRGAELELGS